MEAITSNKKLLVTRIHLSTSKATIFLAKSSRDFRRPGGSTDERHWLPNAGGPGEGKKYRERKAFFK